MQVKVEAGQIQNYPADTIIVNLFEGLSQPGGATGAVDRALGGAISELIAGGDLRGKEGEVAVLYPRGAIPAQRVLVVGLGEREKFSLEGVRRASAYAALRARELNAKQVATILHGAGMAGFSTSVAAQAVVEGTLLALYRYEELRTKPDGRSQIESLSLVEMDQNRLEEVQAGADRAQTIVAGVTLARNLVNMPPNIATPTCLAQAAQEIADSLAMRITIGDRAWAAERGMGGFLAVAKGAGEEPRFIVLEHNAERQDLDTIVLVGKGITFDTGGISIKPAEKMGKMKSDMAGAAAVLGTLKTTGMLDLPLRVIGIAPCTENMPGSGAYHPADVITASNGKTIEIISTDAEGRMVLADGLVYAARYSPKAVIDLATLTGACITALGEQMAAGLFTTHDWLRERLVASAEATHERVWPMPLWDDYKKSIHSEVADIKNSGGKNGGVGTSAIFLKEFTDYPWAHIDMAGMALTDKQSLRRSVYAPLGATGYGVRLMIEFLRNWEAG